MIEKLREINDRIIDQTNNEEVKKKQLLIKKILKEDDCFLKMNIETSYALLRELMIPEEQLKDIYMKLIDLSK